MEFAIKPLTLKRAPFAVFTPAELDVLHAEIKQTISTDLAAAATEIASAEKRSILERCTLVLLAPEYLALKAILKVWRPSLPKL